MAQNLTESGTLVIGVEYGGEMRRAFSIRPVKQKDLYAVRHGKDVDVIGDDDELMGLALLGQRTEISGVPAEAKDLSFMQELYADDLQEILSADERLQERIAAFRGDGKGTAKAGAGAGASEDAVGQGGGDGGGSGGGGEVAASLGGDAGAGPGEETEDPAQESAEA